MDQYASSIRAETDEVFFGSLFWFALLVGVVTAFFAMLSCIASMQHSSALKAFVKNRFIYAMVRVFLFAYLPFAVLTTYTLTLGSAGAAVVAAIFLVRLNWWEIFLKFSF